MKLTVLLALTLSISALAVDSAKIEKNFNTICMMAKSCETWANLRGKNTRSMLLSLGLDLEDEEVQILDLKDDIPEVDGDTYGMMSSTAALKFVDFFVEEDSLTKKQGKAIKEQLFDLRGTGVEFGFTPNRGGSICGMPYPSLLIIDHQQRKIYSINLFGHPKC